jgi:transcription antitermination factor NusG
MAKAKGNKFCWVVAYINSEFLDIVQKQLSKYAEYKDVEPLIPTIKVLKKKFKGKQQFQDVPLLFQYGFFKMPRKFAIHYSFLENMQKNISCIYGWVKDPHKVIGRMKKRRGIEDNDIPVATATAKEISKLIRASLEIGAHGSDDLQMLKEGDFIILKGYPYEGVEAEYIRMDEKKRMVRVRIIMFNQMREIDVSYDNVFFTIYQNKGYDDSVSTEASLDEMVEKKTFDKLMGKLSKNVES